jgi:hypothetical protein
MMTQPNTSISSKGGNGGAGGAGGFSTPTSGVGGFGTPIPKPKMTDEELRLECVRLAVQAKVQPSALINTAESMVAFVKSGAK